MSVNKVNKYIRDYLVSIRNITIKIVILKINWIFPYNNKQNKNIFLTVLNCDKIVLVKNPMSLIHLNFYLVNLVTA